MIGRHACPLVVFMYVALWAPASGAQTAALVDAPVEESALRFGNSVADLTEAERHISQRFETARALVQQGLISAAEYAYNREACIGALLPHSKTPGGDALHAPIPPWEVVSEAFKAIQRGQLTRQMTAEDAAAARVELLDRILPSTPLPSTTTPRLPADEAEAMAMVSHLVGFRQRGLISDAEFEAEREAIYRLPYAPVLLKSQDTKAKKDATQDKNKAFIDLYFFPSRDDAEKAWNETNAAFLEDYAKLQASFREVDTGDGNGVRHHVVVGPFRLGDAIHVCAQVRTLGTAARSCRVVSDVPEPGSVGASPTSQSP